GTGSRTGLLVAIIGLALRYRLKLGKLAIVLVLGGMCTFAALQFFEESGGMADRMISTENTRAAAWSSMWGDFRSSPLFGDISELSAEGRYSENSYLLVASRGGLFVLAPMLAACIATIVTLIRLQRGRNLFGTDILLVD